MSETSLRPAIVLGTTEEACTVLSPDGPAEVPYARFFPAERAERVSPGHLVAVGAGFVVWRWFDAVVVGAADEGVRLWEPGHGLVVAQPRPVLAPGREYRPGSRAYLSAGLPGAEWWVAGPAVDRAEAADVELAELESFLTNDLWGRV